MNSTKTSEKQKIYSDDEDNRLKPSSWAIYGGNVLWLPVLALTGFGILFVYSSSSVYAAQHFGNEFYFAKKQVSFLIPAIIAGIIAAKVPLEFYYKHTKALFFLFVILTLATNIPHLGRKISGAQRWLNLGFTSVQPSEFLKIFATLFMVWIVMHYNKKKHIWIDVLFLMLAPAAIIVQKDLGTTVVVITSFLAILFINGLPTKYFAGLFGVLGAALTGAILFEPYRIARVMTFLNPFKDPLGAGFQVIQSFVAVANGGLFGRGIGESQQKLFFLPEAHTDFILAVITEEMGFIGIVVLAILYSVLYYAILRLVLYARCHEDRLLAAGVFAMLMITTIINMAVVAGALPTKGLPLPFISNGGSAIIANFFLIGLMSQISKRIYTLNHFKSP